MSLIALLVEYKKVVGWAAVITFFGLCVCMINLFTSLKLKRKPRLKAKSPLTPNEVEFYRRLQKALPEFDVMPQVAMSSLIDTDLAEDHPEYWAQRHRFAQKVVDFVVYRRKPVGVIALIELDDRTHDANKDAMRDAMTREAGLVTLRFESRSKPSVEEIRRKVLAVASMRNSR